MKRSDDFFDLLSQFRTVARAGRNRHHLEMSPLEMSPVVVPQQSDDLRSDRMLVEIRRDIGDPNSIVAVSRPFAECRKRRLRFSKAGGAPEMILGGGGQREHRKRHTSGETQSDASVVSGL